jgi:VIT1/CCC1 family predicted Fe2+/Mn2+ transporter
MMKPEHNEEQLHSQNKVNVRFQEYLGQFVYGGIDGSVTTFAVVAGAAGAGLSSAVVLILGFANLFADGFAMSVGAYLSTRSEQQNYDKHAAVEGWEVENMPREEREEVREIYRQKGFEGDLLEEVVDVICANKERWVDTMMKDELNMMREKRSALLIGASTFAAFVVVGLIPLAVYVWDYFFLYPGSLFLASSVLTSLAFAVIGYLKSYVTETSRMKGVLETLLLGCVAAAVAYFVGDILEQMIS